MKYKIGDKVKVRENLLTGRDYNGLYFSKGMSKFEGKESAIEEIYSDCYYLELTTEYGFTDDMLEPVEDTLMVRCIDNEDFEDRLTIGKIYEVTDVSDADEFYSVTNDLKMEDMNYLKDRFEIVKEDKQVKEYTFLEVVINIEDNETYTSDSPVYVIKSIKKENGNIKFFYHGACNDYIGLNSHQRFIKVEPIKEYSFLEAWKAQEEGIEVVSCDCYHYKNNQRFSIDSIWIDDLGLSDEEIKGKWQILK